MKKNALPFLIVLACLIVSHSLPAQTLWGTLPHAFFKINTTGEDYSEEFKNFDLGSIPSGKLLKGQNGALFGSGHGNNGSVIYSFTPGSSIPTILYETDTADFTVHLIDAVSGYIYGQVGQAIFKAKTDGTSLTILRGADGSGHGAYNLQVLRSGVLFGLRHLATNERDHKVLFRIGADGSGYTEMRQLSEEEQLTKFIVHDEESLWGISYGGGAYGKGAVYSFSPDGTVFYKMSDFRGSLNEGEEDYLNLVGQGPVLIQQDLDSDFYIITEGDGIDDFGGISMLGQDGPWDLYNFPSYLANPVDVTMDEEGTLFGFTGLINDEAGFLYSYNPREGFSFEELFDFNTTTLAQRPISIVLGDDGLVYGLSGQATSFFLQNGTIFSITKEGTGLKRLVYFKDGYNPVDITSQGNTLIGVFRNSHETDTHEDVGSIFTYGNGELNYIYKFDEFVAESTMLTAGNDGFVYGVNPDNDFIVKVSLAGHESLKTDIPGLDSKTPLSKTTLGLFGTSATGGANNCGYLFKVKDDFTGIDIIHHFDSTTGKQPYGKLINAKLSSPFSDPSTLYGTTRNGGYGYGVIYSVTPETGGYAPVFKFNGTTLGTYPMGGVIKDENNKYYGTTSAGGQYNEGVLFKMNSDGSGYTKLFDFRGTYGKKPVGELILDANGNLYGLTSEGGNYNAGVLYRIKKNGTGYTKLKDFLTTPKPNLTLVDPLGPTTYVVNPGDNQTQVTVKPAIKALVVPGASTYTFQVSTTSDFSANVRTETSNTSEVQFIDPTLQYSTKYYTRVKTDVSLGYGKVTSFTTHAPEKYCFVLAPPRGTQEVPVDNVDVLINIVYGATTYTVELNTKEDFTGISIVKTTTSRNLTISGLSPRTLYYNRVKTNLSPNWGEVRMFYTISPVYVIQPADNAQDVSVSSTLIKVLPLTFPGYVEYNVQLSKTPDFHELVDNYTGTNPDHTVTGLEYSTTYYTKAYTNYGFVGPVTKFTTHAPEKYSFVSSPVNGATNVAINNLKVTANIVYGATSYTIELNTKADFTGISFLKTSTLANQRTLTFNGLSSNTKYYNRTRTNLPSDWGPVRSFTTALPGAPPVVEESEQTSARVFPNPFKMTFTVVNESIEQERILMSLIDATGRELYKTEVTDGQSVELGEDLASGLYLLKLEQGSTTQTHRMIKNR